MQRGFYHGLIYCGLYRPNMETVPPCGHPPIGVISPGQLVRPSGIVPIALLVVSLAGAALGGARAAPQQPESDFRSLIERGRPSLKRPGGPREFYFTRGVYSSAWRWQSWATDYPKADRQFMLAVNSLIDISAAEHENAIRLSDPEIRRFPFLYALEVGNMALSASEAAGLRGYLLAGGFLVIDDFWGSWEWANFEQQIRRVLPGHRIVDVPLSHPIFNAVYRIDEVLQVPAIGNHWQGRTWERDGYVPHVRGIFDEDGRLMVVINWNTDLGDAWEWFERPEYPLNYSSFAVQMGVNFIVYAMSH